ncbi:MAG: protein kinase [Cyanobacteria bacterium P01_F01_bin.150]
MLLNNRFHVVKSLESDGFGETLVALDTHRSKLCVLRCIKLDFQSPPHQQLASRQFCKVAETLQNLDHDQIPKLYDHFQDSNQYYLAQEWLEGPSLEASVKYDHPLPANKVCQFLIELLTILKYIHRQKVIHRDIKPENIIFRKSDSKAVLVNFGSIKETLQTMIRRAGESYSLIEHSDGFAPPEQISGQSVHYSSDVYAAGMTAIYALTGKRPREMSSDSQTSNLLWRKHAPAINEEFATILDRAIQINPANRYQSADAMLQNLLALEREAEPVSLPPTVVEEVPSPRPPVAVAVSAESPTPVAQSPQRSLPWSVAALALVFTVMAGGIGLHFSSMQADEPDSRLEKVAGADASYTSKLSDEDADARLLDAQRLTSEAAGLEASQNPDAAEKFQAAATNLLSIPAGNSAYEQATLDLANILAIEISRTQAAVEALKIDSQLKPLNLTKRSLKAADWTGNTDIYDPQAPVVTRLGESKIQGYALRDTWESYQKRTSTLNGGRHFQAIWAEEDNNNGEFPDIWIESYQVVPGQLDVTVMYGCMTQSVIQLEGYFNQDLGMEFMDKTLGVWLDGANTNDASQALKAVYDNASVKERTFVADGFVGMVQRTDEGKIMVLVRG